MNSRLQELKNAIHIQNEYFRVAGPILEHVKEQAKKFIGKKIETQTGLGSKFSEALKIDRDSIEVKPLEGAKYAHVHYVVPSCSFNSLSIEISLCFSDGKTGAVYEKRSWYFGKTENGILVSIDENCKAPTRVLDFETEVKSIKLFREAEKLAEEAEERININREAYRYLTLDYLP
jgi:hypothetical protein